MTRASCFRNRRIRWIWTHSTTRRKKSSSPRGEADQDFARRKGRRIFSSDFVFYFRHQLSVWQPLPSQLWLVEPRPCFSSRGDEFKAAASEFEKNNLNEQDLTK